MTKNKNLLLFNKIIHKKNSNKLVFIVIALLLLLTMCIMSRDAGISGDEYFHVDHAENVWNYYKTFGKDKTALYDSKTLHLYGQSLDNLTHVFNEIFNIDDIYTSRHIFSSIAGWILILFSGLIAALLFGWRAGYLAMLLLFFSPRILGHSFNNLKDIPFASAYIFTIYFIILFVKELPRYRKRVLLCISFGISWAISIRIGGIILIPYLFAFVGLHYLTSKNFYRKRDFFAALKIVAILLATAIIGYFLGLIFWPFALQSPFENPFESFVKMSDYKMYIFQLFEGVIQKSSNLPWYYGIKYMLISSPIIVLTGVLLFIVTVPLRKPNRKTILFYLYLTFALAFPIFFIIVTDANIYGGWRHLLWTYSPLVIFASGGFEYFLSKNNKLINYGTLAMLLILAFHPLKHTIKNHPYQYVYYNQLVAGVKGAYANYEMDYYYHSIREGVEWLIENRIEDDSIVVATNHNRIAEYYFRNTPQVKVKYCQYYEKGKEEWDYAIWANTHITPMQLQKEYWPPQKTIHTMCVDNMPIGCVVKRISYEDIEGFKAMEQNELTEAKAHFKNFLSVYPENEEVLEGSARAMFLEQKFDSTIIYADSALFYNANKAGSWILKASALNAQEKYNEAIKTCNSLLNIKEEYAGAYFRKGYALKKLDKPNDALTEFSKAIQYNEEYYQAIMQMGEILCNHKQYNKAINTYRKVFKFKANDVYATIFSAKCYHLLNDNNKAIKLLESIPTKSQYNMEAIKLKCRIAINTNDMNIAGQLLKLVSTIGHDADLFVVRAIYVVKQNRVDLAKLYLEKAIELDGTNQEAKTMLKSLEQPKPATIMAKPATKQKQQQSIMFQKPKDSSNPISIPAK